MSLPLPWVDRIFAKLTLVYGQQFLNRWRDLDMDAVKFDWANELDGFENHPTAIAFALQNIDPEKPPTVMMFRAIANRAPAADLPSLPAPKADPARVAAEFEKLTQLRTTPTSPHGMKEWAYRLKERDARGEKINSYQRMSYKIALKETA